MLTEKPGCHGPQLGRVHTADCSGFMVPVLTPEDNITDSYYMSLARFVTECKIRKLRLSVHPHVSTPKLFSILRLNLLFILINIVKYNTSDLHEVQIELYKFSELLNVRETGA
jgi:hypothetical protein